MVKEPLFKVLAIHRQPTKPVALLSGHSQSPDRLHPRAQMHGKIIGSHLVQEPVRAGAYIRCASMPGEQIPGSDSLI
jgi:hypothetical protein